VALDIESAALELTTTIKKTRVSVLRRHRDVILRSFYFL